MAVISWGALEPLDFRTIDFARYLALAVTDRAPRYHAGDLRFLGLPDHEVEFFGNGFGYDTAGQLAPAEGGDVGPIDSRASFRGPPQAAEEPQRRGLARAIRSDERGEFARRERDVEAAHQPAVVDRKARAFEREAHRYPTSRR